MADSVNHSRKSLREDLAKALAVFYGYSVELSRYLVDMFKIDEIAEAFEANERTRPLTCE